jgi:hypothetical protein
MIHHASEIEHSDFMVEWADQATNTASRRRIYESAASEGAMMIASHIRNPGRINCVGGKAAWTDVPLI